MSATREDLAITEGYAAGLAVSVIAQSIGVKPRRVMHRAQMLGLKHPAYHRWSAEDDAAIRQGYHRGETAEAIATGIGVPATAVQNRAVKLSIKHCTTGRTLAERFASYVLPEPNSGCWLWEGSLSRQGYGQLRTSPTVLRAATHISLELIGKPVPVGMYACHHCDTPACVNPDHLFIGTQRDNMADCIAKGRASKPPIAKPGQGKQEFCKRGHPLSGENLYSHSTGRRCRECSRIHKRNLRARLAASGLTTRGTPKAAMP